MKAIARFAALLAIAVASNLVSAEATGYLGEASLCHKNEIEYFGCKLQDSNKIVSVCAANNTSPDHGYVQYRFGVRDNIEYKFPDKLIPPRGKFSIVDVYRLPDGLGSHMKFTSEPYTYVISSALVPGEIYVAKNGKVVFDKICRGATYVPFDNAARRGLEYGVVDSVDELDHRGR